MKKIIWRTFLVSALLSFSVTYACTPKPVTITTAAGATAFTADQAVVRVNELMNAAIAANSINTLDTATTRTIVTFCVDADQVLAKTPAGWQATVKAAWAIAKPQIRTTNATITFAVTAADAAIQGLHE